jgi:hypothetical protein
MIVSIPNDAELYALSYAMDCPNKPVCTLLKHMQTYYTTPPFDEKALEVHINPDLLSHSYQYNPSMLAKNSNIHVFAHARGLSRDGNIVVLYTQDVCDGQPFLTRLREFIEKNDWTQQIEFPVEEIPNTYRYRPEILRYVFKKMGYSLLIRKGKTHHTFRRAKE